MGFLEPAEGFEHEQDDAEIPYRLTTEGSLHVLELIRATAGYGFDYDLIFGEPNTDEALAERYRMAYFLDEMKMFDRFKIEDEEGYPDEVLDEEDVDALPPPHVLRGMIMMLYGAQAIRLAASEHDQSLTEFVEGMYD